MSEDVGPQHTAGGRRSFLDALIRFCLENKLVVGLVVIFFVGWGILVAPFDWDLGGVPRSPVPVDAIPDIGENQQIVFTEWMGRSPQDVEDQITYPLTVSLLGIPGVKTIRSYSFFGFSSIYIIFNEKVDFYWSRSRVLEKLNSLPAGTLPEGVQPTLGPDATALGQVFWYTLEGRDPEGNPVGGWDLHELRTIQDWYVRYALLSAEGISEVASVGGFVAEYQIDVDPDAMRAHRVTLAEVFDAVRKCNVDVGARTIEVSRVEYVIRGLGFIKTTGDIEKAVIKVTENVPISVKDVATVTVGPALRRGALDKGGAEAVGGVVVVRYGFNPLEAIKNAKQKIAEVAPGLPTKAVVDYNRASRTEVEQFAEARGFEAYAGGDLNQEEWLAWLRRSARQQWPDWVRTSQVTIVPFYDRTGLIYETLGTLNTALVQEILVTIIVVIVSVVHLRSSALISGALPLAVLMCFVAMRLFKVDANVVALSGIAIAIGTIVDMSIIVCENILKHLDEAGPEENRLEVVFRASREVGGAVLTAVATTVISFLPVFTMTGAEGKLFKPLAFTKTFALVASVIVALTIVPAGAHLLFVRKVSGRVLKGICQAGLIAAGVVIGLWLGWWWVATALVIIGLYWLVGECLPPVVRRIVPWVANVLAVVFVGVILTRYWEPLGPERGLSRNLIFVAALIGGLLGFFYLFRRLYAPILRWCLAYKVLFLPIPVVLVVVGVTVWFGLGKEFMPPLDEGSFLFMPTTMPHASIGEALDVLQKQDLAISAIPEVESVVGKIGRVESPLDPAPISMVETVINYKPEYMTDKGGRRIKFRRDGDTGEFVRDDSGELIPDAQGTPYRQWRDHAIARYGIKVRQVQNVIEVAIGGKRITTTVEGRERYPVRVRYLRELRDQIETLGRILVPAPDGTQIPLEQIAQIRYLRGPQAIKSEDIFLVGYVLFDMKPGYAEVDVVEDCQRYLEEKEKSGEFVRPQGVEITFAGTYENQVRARKTLTIVLPVALFIIFMILYFQFHSVTTTFLVFSGIIVAWAGGFLLIWFYAQPWFLNFTVFGVEMRGLFQIHTINLSVAVWVGFLALFGIASDNGVVIATYLDQSFAARRPDSIGAIREATVAAAVRRIRPCLMTSATTILALIPILTSTGRGSDVMVPMAIPSFGGMLVVLVSVFVVPVLYCLIEEVRFSFGLTSAGRASGNRE